MTVQEFEAPAAVEWSGLLLALWWDERGNWDQARGGDGLAAGGVEIDGGGAIWTRLGRLTEHAFGSAGEVV